MTTKRKVYGGNNVKFESSESSVEEDKGISNREYNYRNSDVEYNYRNSDVNTTVCVLNQFILDESILAEYSGKGGGEDNDDATQVLEEFDIENKKCDGSDDDSNKEKGDTIFLELLSWVKNIAVNPCDDSKVGLTCNNKKFKNPKWKTYGPHDDEKVVWKNKVLLYREAASIKKRFRSSSEQEFWKSQKMCPVLYDEEPKEGIYNLRKKLKKNNNGRFSPKKSTFSIHTPSYSLLNSDDSEEHEEEEKEKEKNMAKKSFNNSSRSDSFLNRHIRVKHVPIGPRHQAVVPEWNGGGPTSPESDSKWLGTRLWPSKHGMNPRVVIERDPIGNGRQDSCGCPGRGLVDCVGFHVAEKRTKLKLELGRAFYELDLDKPGADTKNLLSEEEDEEEKK